MTLVTVDEAAGQLNLSVRQVQRLARAGNLVLVGPNRIDWESVLRHQVARQGYDRRAWAEDTAWAAVAMLAHVEVTCLGQPQRSRLNRQLIASSSEEVVARTRNRAVVHRLTGHRAALDRIAGEMILSGANRNVGDLTASTRDRIDGYVDSGQYDGLVARYRLTADAGEAGNVVLRVTGFDVETVAAITQSGDVLAGLDLATSLDTRERSTGMEVLGHALEGLR